MSLSSEEKNAAYEKLTPQRKQLVDIISEIRNFAITLDDTDPVKYSVQDVFGE